MLRLVRVQILGFKSFCDRTEVSLSGHGIAAVVGPNGCGKSNISDAITWVLGEQSAKSLRGVKMEDVIFAGTRERRPTGMAEVSLTLLDPDVYDGGEPQTDGPELVIAERHPAEEDGISLEDWDEQRLREQTAAETEAAVAEAQPGVVLDASADDVEGQNATVPAAGGGGGTADQSGGEEQEEVTLRIRRRKFNRAPVRAGEVTVTRRLFRSGDSEYLLNGRICRLRDIQDIFLGTGLGSETYAIIGQERIGQLLSSKPTERRGIIEEAAGITRFKTRRRLAELRLESAKQNLARVNDIFDEVAKQMNSLRRQAAKAERYGALRDELRARLRVVLCSRLAMLDADAEQTKRGLEACAASLETQAGEIDRLDAEHTAGMARSFEMDTAHRTASETVKRSAVELERVNARAASNRERMAELSARLEGGAKEREGVMQHAGELSTELEQQRRFLGDAAANSSAAREEARAEADKAQAALKTVQQTEAQMEGTRRGLLQAVQKSGLLRNEIAKAEATLANLEAEARRLEQESEAAHKDLESLGQQRGQMKMNFESVTQRLQRLEAEMAELRLTTEEKRRRESESKRRADGLRSKVAELKGRRGSLEGLIRDHSYSTETVKNLFRATRRAAHAQNGAQQPLGTLADFLEPETQYGALIDEFLREELNYVVVQDWASADRAVELLRVEVNGRATLLVQQQPAAAPTPEMPRTESDTGTLPLREAIRVAAPLSQSLYDLLPKLRDGYIVISGGERAKELSEQRPACWFLAQDGRVFHAGSVTAGRAAASGPLALKRELRDLVAQMEASEAQLAEMGTQIAVLTREIAETQAGVEQKQRERQEAEREAANSGAALRQMESEAGRLNRRLEEWQLAAERTRNDRNTRQDLIERRHAELSGADAEHANGERALAELQARLAIQRQERETLQAAAAGSAAALAGLDERRRSAQSNFDQTSRMVAAQAARLQQVEGQLTAAEAERSRRMEETGTLESQAEELRATHATATGEVSDLTGAAEETRMMLATVDARLRILRTDADALREQKAQLSSREARLSAELEHSYEACRNDLAVEPEELRQEALPQLNEEALRTEETEVRSMRSRLEAMGPVNMMALEEFGEASERHGFLETQRKDLMDSIANTQASIREIDEVSHEKFEGAFRAINENFSLTFSKLFGGGQAFMKLTDEENATESGIDLVASPPGKKLQNVLLLSGGEKALTALALLVGIFQFQPAPFCILDEVDAPLDETNVGRFAKLIADMSSATQFIVITHSKRTMEKADVIYGVTMQEPGISKIVSVDLSAQKDASRRRAVA